MLDPSETSIFLDFFSFILRKESLIEEKKLKFCLSFSAVSADTSATFKSSISIPFLSATICPSEISITLLMNYLNTKIREELFSLQDKKYKDFHSSLCPGTDNIIGVRTPVLRTLAKKLSKEINVDNYLNEACDDYYEEVMLQALVIGYIKVDIERRFEYMKKFIPKIYNWAVCDIFCLSLKFTKKNCQTIHYYSAV